LDNLEYIEAYFEGGLSDEDKRAFEKKIVEEAEFANEVSFYLSARQVSAAELTNERERFREIYRQHKANEDLRTRQPGLLRKLWPWVAAAAILAGIIFGWYAWFRPVDPNVLADKYIAENFETLPVTMSSKQDSLQTALRLYNERKADESLKILETLVLQDSTFFEAKKYAGIVSLQMEQYDKAISYFNQLEKYTHLYSNPGKFYKALTLLKRNQPGDKQQAKILLEQVVQNNLSEEETAQEWLKKW
jgi:tetratricopeptide (TPR) repeat protein